MQPGQFSIILLLPLKMLPRSAPCCYHIIILEYFKFLAFACKSSAAQYLSSLAASQSEVAGAGMVRLEWGGNRVLSPRPRSLVRMVSEHRREVIIDWRCSVMVTLIFSQRTRVNSLREKNLLVLSTTLIKTIDSSELLSVVLEQW